MFLNVIKILLLITLHEAVSKQQIATAKETVDGHESFNTVI